MHTVLDLFDVLETSLKLKQTVSAKKLSLKVLCQIRKHVTYLPWVYKGEISGIFITYQNIHYLPTYQSLKVSAQLVKKQFSVDSFWHCCDLEIGSSSLKAVWTGKAQWVVPSSKAWHLSHFQYPKNSQHSSFCHTNHLAGRPNTNHYIDLHFSYKSIKTFIRTQHPGILQSTANLFTLESWGIATKQVWKNVCIFVSWSQSVSRTYLRWLF